MLNNNYNEFLPGLKDIIFEKSFTEGDNYHVYFHMPKKIHECPCCKTLTSKVHDYRRQIVKHGKSCFYNTYLHINKRRYVCPNCGKKFYEKIIFLPKYQRTTNMLWAHVIELLRENRSMKSIGKECNISGTTVARILDQLSYGLDRMPKTIAIDEFRGNAGGEKFQCILTDPNKHKVLDILPARKQDSLFSYFLTFKDRNNVDFVVMDMSPLFKSVVKDCFPNAKIVADKFHVVRLVNCAFENVRKRVQKEFRDSRRKYFKRSRKILLKRRNKLTDDEILQVTNMLELSKDLRNAYYLNAEFQDFIAAKDYYTAKKLLSDWLLKAGSLNLAEFKSCITSFTAWSDEILNMFTTKLSNGFTEGTNNKIKVLKRNAFGYRNFNRFAKRILHMASA